MCGLIVDQHQVDHIALAADEDDLEDGVPEVLGRVRPEEIEVPGDVDDEVEELRFE